MSDSLSKLKMFESKKWEILQFLYNNTDKDILYHIKNLEDNFYSFNINEVDNTDLTFIYLLYALAYEKLWYEAHIYLSYYKKILSLDYDSFVMDDLWIYFVHGLAIWKIAIETGGLDKEVIENIIELLQTWFQVYPKNERDLNDDLIYGTRLNIIQRFDFVLEIIGNILNSNIIRLLNNDWTIVNFALTKTQDDWKQELLVLFGYKNSIYN